MTNDREIIYHLDSADECRAAGYSDRYNREMADMLIERKAFYERFPTKRSRKSARKEGVKVGHWY